ncbi:hypothetical protein BDE02_11G084300 [Populus trichocarpa]|nr:hypothetical protein BDE02_11G084300 [Populus trichocarpa]
MQKTILAPIEACCIVFFATWFRTPCKLLVFDQQITCTTRCIVLMNPFEIAQHHFLESWLIGSPRKTSEILNCKISSLFCQFLCPFNATTVHNQLSSFIKRTTHTELGLDYFS